MYSTARKMAMLAFIVAVFAVISAVFLAYVYFPERAGLNFTERFTWILFTVCVAGGSLVLSWGLFDLSKDLAREYSSNAEYLHKLNKRIKALEDKQGML